MKKTTFLITFLMLFNFSIAQEIQNVQMPTDEEIRQTIEKYDFSREQKEYLFKETKKNLQELYSNKDFQSVLNKATIETNQNLEKSLENYNQSKEDIDNITNQTKTYSKSQPLFKKQKYGPTRF